MNKPTDLLTLSAVAEMRSTTRRTVLGAIWRGELPATAAIGPGGAPAYWLVRRADARAWGGAKPVGRPRRSA